MKVNVGSADRVLRIVVGLLILAVGIYLQAWWGIIGLIVLLTGLLKRCPAYSLIKVDTLPKQ